MSQKQDAGWIRAAFGAMLLLGGVNALLGGLGVSHIFPLFLDEFMGYDESIRSLAEGLIMMSLAIVTVWRRAQAAPLFAALLVVAVYGMTFINTDKTTLVAAGQESDLPAFLPYVVPITQGIFALLFTLLMARAVWALRRKTARR